MVRHAVVILAWTATMLESETFVAIRSKENARDFLVA
jgi:hypothetical protein